jgi:hypothetical protein
LAPILEKIKHFENKGGAKILCLEKKLEAQMMALSQENKDCVGPQKYSSNNTLAKIIYTAIQANIQ